MRTGVTAAVRPDDAPLIYGPDLYLIPFPDQPVAGVKDDPRGSICRSRFRTRKDQSGGDEENNKKTENVANSALSFDLSRKRQGRLPLSGSAVHSPCR